MEERKFKLELTENQINVIYQSLLELPAKFSMPVMEELKKQLSVILNEELKEEVKE